MDGASTHTSKVTFTIILEHKSWDREKEILYIVGLVQKGGKHYRF